MNQQLNTPEKCAAFREDFQADVYAKAFSLTRNENGANALTDQIFTMMEQRFANRVLPLNCLTYLKGQTTLLHARLGGELNRAQPEPAPIPVEEPAPAPTIKAFRVHRVRRPAPVVIPAEEIPEVLNVSEAVEETPEVETPVIVEEIPAVEETPVAEEEPLVEAATREETLFDEDKTALWMPGESFDLEELTEAQEAFRAQPKDTSNKRSVKLTIFNTFLFLCAIAATIFLLAELGLLPRLF